MKNQLKKIPFLGAAGRSAVHALRKLGRTLRNKPASKYDFVRIDTVSQKDPDQTRIINLLNYTKTSESAYNAEDFPAAYHSIKLKDLDLRGQRDPMDRIKLVPLDFEGKTVLDIGCNQGGMLFSIAGKIKHGVGIDYDRRLINAANRIKSYAEIRNIDFYVFNLEEERLELISDFLPDEKVDVAFLLAVCMWISNWKDVIQFAKKSSNSLLFESNGKKEQQLEQLEYLRSVYDNVKLISAESKEDALQKNRKLYFCQ